jgi:metal-responsive CopG/Arc/MetJ family transcriptional regulator
MDKTIKLGITLPKSLVQQIDRLRGDIPRSRYILRAIENYVSDIDRHAKEKKVTSTTKSKKEKI